MGKKKSNDFVWRLWYNKTETGGSGSAAGFCSLIPEERMIRMPGTGLFDMSTQQLQPSLPGSAVPAAEDDRPGRPVAEKEQDMEEHAEKRSAVPGGEGWQELIVPALQENLERVQEFVGGVAGEDCPMKARMQLDLAVEEIFINIASYAYAPGVGSARVRVRKAEDPAAVTVVFIDRGVPYNPLAKEDPDVSVLAEERKIGGLGIFLTKQVMDELRYEYRDGKNMLTMVKNL